MVCMTYVENTKETDGDLVLLGTIARLGVDSVGIVCFDDDLVAIPGVIFQEFDEH